MTRGQRNIIDYIVMAILVVLIGVYLVWREKKDQRLDAQIETLHEKNLELLGALEVKNLAIVEFLEAKEAYRDTADALRQELTVLKADYSDLVEEKEAELVEADSLAPNESYNRVLATFPDTLERIYLVSPKQINKIYSSILERDYLRLETLKMRHIIYTQDKVIRSQDEIILQDSLILAQWAAKEQNWDDLLGNKDTEIEILGKKIKNRNLSIGIAALSGVVLGFLIAK
jgi:hypothetical protein